MTISTAVEPVRPSDEAAAKRGERRALGVACGAHMLHDGYTDLVWVALPIWQAEFGLNYAVVGLLRTIYSGTLASLQIPAAAVAARIGSGTVLAAGTTLAGLCYCLAGLSSGFALLVLALLLGGVGAATQHPIGSALVTRAFSGTRSLKAFGAYNFAGDVGKVLLPATATSLLLILQWRPAYTLLGLVGIVAAIAIAILTPGVAPEPQPASAELCHCWYARQARNVPVDHWPFRSPARTIRGEANAFRCVWRRVDMGPGTAVWRCIYSRDEGSLDQAL
jgi:MFS transporter, FSR family, fosmidomycin resistance protein